MILMTYILIAFLADHIGWLTTHLAYVLASLLIARAEIEPNIVVPFKNGAYGLLANSGTITTALVCSGSSLFVMPYALWTSSWT
jgi:hypothetical protein